MSAYNVNAPRLAPQQPAQARNRGDVGQEIAGYLAPQPNVPGTPTNTGPQPGAYGYGDYYRGNAPSVSSAAAGVRPAQVASGSYGMTPAQSARQGQALNRLRAFSQQAQQRQIAANHARRLQGLGPVPGGFSYNARSGDIYGTNQNFFERYPMIQPGRPIGSGNVDRIAQAQWDRIWGGGNLLNVTQGGGVTQSTSPWAESMLDFYNTNSQQRWPQWMKDRYL